MRSLYGAIFADVETVARRGSVHQNRTRVLIRYDLTDADVQQFAEADRRVVDPPIQVQTAMWSSAGQLDWWVRERQEWWGQGTWCGRAATLDQSR
jgi:hypothetical protein